MIQFRIVGINRKGEAITTIEREDASWALFYERLLYLKETVPDAICFSIQIARPDPEVLKIKDIMYFILEEENKKKGSVNKTVDRLFSTLDIKLKENVDA